MGNVCPQHDQSMIAPPKDQSIRRKTSYRMREPASVIKNVTSALSIRRTKIASIKTVPISLPDLPTEIILIVAQHLPPSSRLFLSYSCPNIRNRMGHSIEQLLGQRDHIAQLPESALEDNLGKLTLNKGVGQDMAWSLPTIMPHMHHSERLELLCMLDRNYKILLFKAICSSCADTHDRSLFSSASLAQSSRERRCLGSAWRIWICPHWMFDHNLVTTAKPQTHHVCGNKGVYVVAGTRPRMVWPIAVLRGNNDAPSKEFVDNILVHMDTNICKHLRFTDEFVSRIYSPDCRRLRSMPDTRGFVGYGQCSACTWRLSQTCPPSPPDLIPYLLTGPRCESCGTSICFLIRDKTMMNKGRLLLIVQRTIGRYRGCTDRAWIEQVTDPAGFAELERTWYATTDKGNENETVQGNHPAQ